MRLINNKLRIAFLAAFTLCAAAAFGQMTPNVDAPPANLRPPGLKKVGIEQHLNQQVPPGLAFRNEDGGPVTLGQYFGSKPIILDLAYYKCPMLCGEVLQGLTSAMRAVSLSAGKDFNILTVSFDPSDTPADAIAKKKMYVERYHRDGAANGWHFLTGSKESVAALAKAAGFEYQYDPKTGQFAHATAIMVLTPQGKISQYFYGVEFAPRDLRLALVQASDEQIGTVVDQVLLYCYHYDPATGKYSATVARVLRAAAAFTLLSLGTMLFLLFRMGPKGRGAGRA